MYLRNCINWNKKKKTPDSPYKYTDRQMDRYIYTDIHALKTSANSRHFA